MKFTALTLAALTTAATAFPFSMIEGMNKRQTGTVGVQVAQHIHWGGNRETLRLQPGVCLDIKNGHKWFQAVSSISPEPKVVCDIFAEFGCSDGEAYLRMRYPGDENLLQVGKTGHNWNDRIMSIRCKWA
ncbi:hypothetical protein QBC35DRAFT_476974 [Podospora australis]|uniref:Beta/gamma crystallin 'Greek key' domain-containing protein n=1 Tax=Podospora australis TaxID=1536484 RepID=A0AAN6WN95_9PEZI|nr:hypothetical protein QBC35DRAFT_476974 [Podospora australis]